MALEYLNFCLYISVDRVELNDTPMLIYNTNTGISNILCAFDGVITNNLIPMADQAGVYRCLWKFEETPFKTAKDMQPIIHMGIIQLQTYPKFFRKFNHKDGWGTYEHLLEFLTKLNEVCLEYPTAYPEYSK